MLSSFIQLCNKTVFFLYFYTKIRVYQVLADTDVRERNRLIDIRYINHSIEGWQIFRVKKAFEKGLPYSEWNDNSKTKHFLITAVNSIGFPVRFKIRRGFELDQVADYQPLLILFNDDTSSIFAEEDTFKNKNIFPQGKSATVEKSVNFSESNPDYQLRKNCLTSSYTYRRLFKDFPGSGLCRSRRQLGMVWSLL